MDNWLCNKITLLLAESYFLQAIAGNPSSSQARWGYIQAYLLIKNADLLFMISSIYSKKNIGTTFNTMMNPPFSLPITMNTIITYLDDPTYSVVQGKADNIISPSDFSVNFNLMIAYFFAGLAKIGDSNGDSNYFQL